MSHAEAKKIARAYAHALDRCGYPVAALYLFGSHRKGRARRSSDIDVAVVSPRLRKREDQNRLLLWQVRRDVDPRIEPHGFTPEDFADEANPTASEIRHTGIRIR